MVIDGGYESTGHEICAHIRRWYGTDVIDHVVSSHPDNDHMSGLRVVLNQMTVRQLWMHVPEAHAARILPAFNSPGWTNDRLRDALRRAYPFVTELRQLVIARGGLLSYPFQGSQVGPFTVLSPSMTTYEGLMPQFRDTPAFNQGLFRALGLMVGGVGSRVSQVIRRTVRESWTAESLREGGVTAAENQSSVVLYGNLGAGCILLTADAGLAALSAAADYAESLGVHLSNNLWLFQVPHHGSRNNVSPSILNRLVGPPVPEGHHRPVRCIVSAGIEDETHPRQVVVNALIRRGLTPTVTRGRPLRCEDGIGPRPGWGPAQSEVFSGTVEEYD
jgi:hypothetical protein